MLFILLIITISYFFIITKLRREHTESIKAYQKENPGNSFIKVVGCIFEILNKASLVLLATLLVFGIIGNELSKVEFLLWIALIHLVPTTFMCGILEIVLIKETIKK